MSAVYFQKGLGPDKTFLFDAHQIDQIFAIGYQDQEQMAFKVRIDKALEEIRAKENAKE